MVGFFLDKYGKENFNIKRRYRSEVSFSTTK